MSSPFAELQAELPQCNVSVFDILAGLVVLLGRLHPLVRGET